MTNGMSLELRENLQVMQILIYICANPGILDFMIFARNKSRDAAIEDLLSKFYSNPYKGLLVFESTT